MECHPKNELVNKDWRWATSRELKEYYELYSNNYINGPVSLRLYWRDLLRPIDKEIDFRLQIKYLRDNFQ